MASLAEQWKAAKQLYNTGGLNVFGTNVHPGSWSVGGVRLPDLGVTEALAQGVSSGQTTDLTNAIAGYYPQGETLPAQTETPVGTPTGGITPTGGTPTTTTNEPSVPSIEDQLRAGIGSAYDQYLADLDNILMAGLPAQETAQQGIIESQYQQGVSGLGTQKELGLADLSAEERKINLNQVRTLKDVSANIRNLMQSGQNMLGTMGASGSAPGRFAYALTKVGSQQRGGVMAQFQDLLSQVSDRRFKLNTMYNGEINKLAFDRDQKVLGVVNWFNEQQNALREMMAQVGFNKQQDLNSLMKTRLDQAYSQLNAINTETQNRRLMLDQWAMNNSTTLAGLQKNLQNISAWQASNIMYSPLSLSGTNMAQGGQSIQYAPYGGYAGTTDEEDLFS